MATDVLQCPQCRQQVFPEDRYCAACGAGVEGGRTLPLDEAPGTLTRALFMSQGNVPVSPCVSCSRPVLSEDHFCSICGASQPGTARSVAGGPPGSADMWEEVLQRLRHSTLGEYEIAGKLGSGGMAAVFLAHEIALNRKVAIKVMAPTFLVDPGLVERFRQEARTVAALRHPNIVNIHAVREVDHLHFFVMQFISGRSVAEIVKAQGPLPIPVIAAILFQVGSALAYAHRRGVIHRDIKPANIMLDDEGNAIVTDFGIAKVSEAPQFTMTGGTIGTPAYMSPEQCNATGGITGASDQYSLGIVGYELLTGAPPFAGPHYAVMGAHVLEAPPPILDRRPDCPPEMAAAVLRMLAKAPGDRFASASEAGVAAGGAPLPDHDPIREQLIALAARTESRAQQLRASTPASPLPRQVSLPSGPTVADIQVGQVGEQLSVGRVIRLGVRLTDPSGTEVTSSSLSWRSDAPGIASVQPDGRVTCHAPGRATISVSCQGRTATSVIWIASPAPARIEVNPATVRLAAGRSLQLASAVLGEDGRPLTGQAVRWTSQAPDVASVTPEGALTAVGVGATTLVARCDQVTASVAVEVTEAPGRPTARVTTQPPARRPLVVLGGTAAGLLAVLLILLVFDPFGWRRSEENGDAGRKGRVVPAVPATLTLTPARDSLAPRDSLLIAAAAQDSAGRTVDAGPTSWTAEPAGLVELEPRGASALVRAVAPGQVTIRARLGGIGQDAIVVVQAIEIRRLGLAAGRRELTVGESVQLEVRNASTEAGPVSFHSGQASVATVSEQGVVRAVGAGRVDILAVQGGDTATVTLTVRTPATETLSIEPATLDLEAGETGRLTLKGARPGALRWLSSDSTRARVTAAGPVATITGVAPGGAEIRVTTAAGASARVTVRVTERARLQLSTTQVAFEQTAGAAPPPAQTVSVSHSGAGDLTVADPEYTPPGQAWLGTKLGGDVLTVGPIPAAAALAPGQYSARVAVIAGKQRRALGVTLTVKEAAGPSGVTATKAELQQVLDDYAAAINAGDAARIRQVYPAISKRGLDDLLDIAKNRGSASYDLRLRGEPKPGPKAGTMQGEVIALFLGGKRSGGITNLYAFTFQDRRWVIAGWKPISK